MSWSSLGLAASTLLASAVEFVEAFTIVLAMGLTRGWRSTIAGTVSALVLLAVVTAVAGYALVNWFPGACCSSSSARCCSSSGCSGCARRSSARRA